MQNYFPEVIMNKSFFVGLFTGILMFGIYTVATKNEAPASAPSVAAMIGDEVLTESELRKKAGMELIPIQSDEYHILLKTADAWLVERLLEKEAAESKISKEELFTREVWGQVAVPESQILEAYNKNKHVYNQPFEKVQPKIFKELREKRFEQVKAEYVTRLKGKYRAAILLKKPDSLIPEAPALMEKSAAAEGVAQNMTAPSRGPENAPLVLDEYADFECSFCKKAEVTLKKVAAAYPMQLKIVFHHYPLTEEPGEGSFLVHEGSTCAQEQGKFWEYHDAVLNFSGSINEAEMNKIAEQIGLSMPQFQSCIQEGKYRDFILSEREAGKARGVDGTPTFFLGKQKLEGAYPFDRFVKIIEAALDPKKAAELEAESAKAAEAAIVKFDDLEGRPSRGPKEAPVTIVEFSDFHCPFCARVLPTLEQVMKNYEGKVRLVWRHYPLPMHQGAERTHVASECASEQGKFWKYHDKLFQTIGGPRDDEALIKLADEADLSKRKFKKCLTSGKHDKLIQSEIQKGSAAGVNGTPAFFINGKLISGAQPYATFEKEINSALARSSEKT
jgi:protein-disulfide isomerase